MNRKNLIVVLVIVSVVAAMATLTFYVRQQAIQRELNEANKTLFSDDVSAQFLDSQSNPVDLTVYEDTVLVVNVWASWSPYTEIEFPILNDIAAHYKDQGVKVLAMNRKESQIQIERYLATIPQYEHIEHIIDVNDFFYAGIDGYAMPETIIYDKNGKIIQHMRGVVVKEDLEKILQQILNQE